MTEAAFQLTKKATETIDMRRPTGQHPRMGATDVIPFIPTMDTSVEAVSYTHLDRKRYGLCLNLSVTDNTVLPSLEQLFKGQMCIRDRRSRRKQLLHIQLFLTYVFHNDYPTSLLVAYVMMVSCCLLYTSRCV